MRYRKTTARASAGAGPPATGNRGFTLMELMVALALGIIIMLITVTAFAQASGLFSRGEARTEAINSVRVTLDYLEKDLMGACLDADGAVFRGDGRSMTFFTTPTYAYDQGGNPRPGAVVYYYLEQSDVEKNYLHNFIRYDYAPQALDHMVNAPYWWQEPANTNPPYQNATSRTLCFNVVQGMNNDGDVDSNGNPLIDEDPGGGIDDDGDGKLDEDPPNNINEDGDLDAGGQPLEGEDPAGGIDYDGDGQVDEDGFETHIQYIYRGWTYPGWDSASVDNAGNPTGFQDGIPTTDFSWQYRRLPDAVVVKLVVVDTQGTLDPQENEGTTPVELTRVIPVGTAAPAQ